MKASCRILPFLLLLALTQSTFGWGAAGHELVGDVAERHLTPKTKAAVRKLLDGRTLADISIWADDIKGKGLKHGHGNTPLADTTLPKLSTA